MNYFSGASVAALIVTYARTLDVSMLVVIVPLLVVSYLTFRSAMGRVEDSNKHLSDLNRLYLSTIETLAMAIDAKDQITHGHIRRVQTYAVGLARRLGINDEKEIRAIEAAALLHDMGKLAVPEYILNKPGKLTPAEFEKMKLHASIGADILSAIDFPYPVVPIVRYHHENWDGSGYPTGLKGSDIPVGARILSVVDCFDALTSDRPYRPAMSDDDAIRILNERRGWMYDPWVVDTFVAVHTEIAPKPSTATPVPAHVLKEITGSAQTAVREDPAGASADAKTESPNDTLALYELIRALNGQARLGETAETLCRYLKRVVPFSDALLFVYDIGTDELVARYSSGTAVHALQDLRVPLGQRLSGWVAANKQIIVNSDPALDLYDVARTSKPPLRSALGIPLLVDGQLVAVLTLYSPFVEGFSDQHRRMMQVISRQVAVKVKAAVAFEASTVTDELTGLPQLAAVEQVVRLSWVDHFAPNANASLLWLQVAELPEIDLENGSKAGDALVRHVVRHARSNLRLSDLLFGCARGELVAVLYETDLEAARAVGVKIRDSIRSHPLVTDDAKMLPVEVRVAVLPLPDEAGTVDDVLASARRRDPGVKMPALPTIVH